MSFEHRLGELLKDDDPYEAGPDPVPIIASARRRRARRRTAAGAAAFTVALVCGVTAVTAGHARYVGQVAGDAGAAMTPSAGALVPAAPGPTPTPTATPTGLPLSPVRHVEPGERVEPVPGVRLSVTAGEKCWNPINRVTGGYSGQACTDMHSPSLPGGRPDLSMEFTEAGDRIVVNSYYLGPTTPTRIVVFEDGRPTVATLLVTAGMKDWVAYYAVLPPNSSRAVPYRAAPAVGAYDADGRLLAKYVGHTADGGKEQPPAVF
ncbi:hypothetical protein [Kitasatospora brasiliensis]|uniref:hypothetical protein n=1 Tax=Kitasatospora brasiliensis TaxID=3058040 RepID=UPI00292D7F68|nr:hypothetical protein [Kitasatospora sp. K002]